MFKDRLKSILSGSRPSGPPGPRAEEPAPPQVVLRSNDGELFQTRMSRGLEQFFGFFRDQAGLTVLDLGGAHQENINFVTNLGHRFYSEDFIRIFEETFAGEPADQSNPGQIDFFLRQVLDYPDEHFDAVLAWDVLEYMSAPLLSATVDRLLRVMKPRGYLLAFFNSADRSESVPCYTFRIQDLRTLQVGESGRRPAPQLFNNRGLEKLFQKFESVKFFLTRESLREVIVRK